MNLHQHLADTLDQETGPDLAALARTARTHGTRLRRRRTAGLVVAAGVAALGLAGFVLVLPGSGDGSLIATGPGVPAPPVVEPDLAGPTAPTTGRGGVLALQWAVDQQRAGVASDLAGQSGYFELRWTDADGLGDSVVGLNVQDDGERGAGCGSTMVGCTDTTSPDGSRLVTYEARTNEPGGTSVRRTVDLYRADGTRVVINATNGFEYGGGRWDLTRAEPPLTFPELEAIVRQRFWGSTLPVAWVEAGATLAHYQDFDAYLSDEPTPSDSP